MSRYRGHPVYVGEVGNTTKVVPDVDTSKLQGVNIDNLSTNEMIAIAIEVGIDVRLILGIDKCLVHIEMVLLEGRELPTGFKLFEHCRYCRNCFRWFRYEYPD